MELQSRAVSLLLQPKTQACVLLSSFQINLPDSPGVKIQCTWIREQRDTSGPCIQEDVGQSKHDTPPSAASHLPPASHVWAQGHATPSDGNLSGVSWQPFALAGFEGGPETQALLFVVFLALYMVTILGNLTMIVVITLDAHLHSPMYFFLKSLSFLDLCYSSVIAPNALANFFSIKLITFLDCTIQFFFSLLATSETFLLAIMACDRFMTVCSPLLYPITMRSSTCTLLVVSTCCGGCLNIIMQTSFTFHLPFCSSHRINHFFCDVPPLLQLACTDTSLNERVLFGLCGFIIVGTTLVVLVSYGYITVTVLRMRSTAGRWKVFSTCGSHLTVVSLFYGTLYVMYTQPGAVESMEQGKVVSVFYTLVIPMLNPLIYSLRNKDVKEALRRLGQKHAAT
ncbi:olfactory receptor 12-like [Choloepus didactylus]|uniref:olfactory receptor 12-like n=1 Tax=Choloepus didactylus TaxID=27675 RepID=UPI0018A00990|nr:olfactory receptor 12-like [Choloepus didactylus]